MIDGPWMFRNERAAMSVLVRSAKEFTRHYMRLFRANGLLTEFRRIRGIKTDYLQGSLADRFASIYRSGAWAKAHAVDASSYGPGSGHGSSLAATKSVQESLPIMLEQLDAKTLVDIGCGDNTWMSQIKLPCDYIGLDIVKTVIADNQKLHASPRRSFLVVDATTDEIPDGDIVLCREVIFHLSFDDIRRLIVNICEKERAYFITTTDTATLFNSDVESGDFRILNLRKAPFNFPDPIAAIKDDDLVPGRTLSIWSIAHIRSVLAKW
jgi:hypothetical protein